MAMDSSWDNSGLPPQKKGMPLWVKILGGCGIVFVLLLGSCVALGFYGMRKVAEIGKAQWPRYVETVKALQDPASTQALYEANPPLQKRYSDAAEFEKQVAEWRSSIQTPPAEMPSFTTGRAMAFESRNRGVGDGGSTRKTSMAGYKMEDGRMLVVVWVNDQITGFRFDHPKGNGGFEMEDSPSH
ncbi:MAG: hypothetical protein JST24_03170 [Acidobacteria bacterium]|nr:hypothetical protein [Acidobacteriota bacterium]